MQEHCGRRDRGWCRTVGRLWPVYVVFLLMPLLAWSSDAPLSSLWLPLDEKSGTLLPGRSMAILEDPGGKLTFADVSSPAIASRFSRSGKDVPGFGFSESAFWVRMGLDHRSPRDELWFLEFAFWPMQIIDVYVTGESGQSHDLRSHMQGGSAMPVSQRRIVHRTHLFPLQLEAGERTVVYLRLAGESSKIIPIKLWRSDAFAAGATVEMVALGIYVGIMLGLTVYNLFIYVTVKEASYALYVLFMTNMLLIFLSLNGMAQQFLWPEWPALAVLMVPVSIAMGVISATMFSMMFLGTQHFAPRLHVLMRVIVVLGVLLIPFVMIVSYHIAIITAVTLLVVACLTMLSAGILGYLADVNAGRYYLLAWTVLLLGIIITGLRSFGILPSNAVTENTIFIGSALEAVLLSVALAARMRALRAEKERAQREALEHQAQATRHKQMVLDTIQEYNRKLEQQVEERTRELLETQRALAAKQKMAALGVMTAGVAHEINNPNNFVSAGIQNISARLERFKRYLLDLVEGEENADIARDIALEFGKLDDQAMLVLEGSKRIQTIVQGMDTLTRLEQVQEKMESISEELSEAARIVAAVASPHIHWSVDIAGTPPSLCNPAALHQAFVNVMNNAVQALSAISVPGVGPRVDVNAVVTSDSRVVVTLRDNGPGMTPEVLQRAFDPFFTTRDVGAGTGLGLSVSRDVIERHGGSIVIDSTPGIGTTVTMALPLRKG